MSSEIESQITKNLKGVLCGLCTYLWSIGKAKRAITPGRRRLRDAKTLLDGNLKNNAMRICANANEVPESVRQAIIQVSKADTLLEGSPCCCFMWPSHVEKLKDSAADCGKSAKCLSRALSQQGLIPRIETKRSVNTDDVIWVNSNLKTNPGKSGRRFGFKAKYSTGDTYVGQVMDGFLDPSIEEDEEEGQKLYHPRRGASVVRVGLLSTHGGKANKLSLQLSKAKRIFNCYLDKGELDEI